MYQSISQWVDWSIEHDSLVGPLIYLLVVCLVGCLVVLLIGLLIGCLVGWLVVCLVGWFVDWLFRWLICWLVCWLIGWLFCWMVGCLLCVLAIWMTGWLFSRSPVRHRSHAAAIVFHKRIGLLERESPSVPAQHLLGEVLIDERRFQRQVRRRVDTRALVERHVVRRFTHSEQVYGENVRYGSTRINIQLVHVSTDSCTSINER